MIFSILTRIILKLLSVKRYCLYQSVKGNRKALLAYVIVPHPKFKLDFFYRELHNRYLMSKLMIQVLNEAGYHVYLYDYLDETVDYSMHYDLFIGHNKSFHKIANKLLSERCERILLTTGCSPEFDNMQLSRRNIELQKRKNTTQNFYKPISDFEYAKINCLTANHIFMIGSSFIREHGWYPEVKSKATLYDNVSLLEPQIKKTGTDAFVFMSSIGQLRRGLDLVLEVFSKRKELIYICGPFDLEPEFVKLFKQELFGTKNIIPVGYVNQRSDHFKEIMSNADFAILPSCSEGQSGSLLNLMSNGLIPVATEHTGFEKLDELGIKIQNFTPDALNQAVDAALGLSLKQRDNKRKQIFTLLATKHSEAAFKNRFNDFLEKIATPTVDLR